MPQHHHQTFDQDGNIISEIIEEYIEEVVLPTPDERIAKLETELADMRTRVNGVAAANAEVKAMRDAIVGKAG